MKATLFILAVTALSLTSCKKEYTCECVKESPSGTTTETENLGKRKLDEARSRCDDGDKTETVLGETYTTECSLK